MKHKLLRLLQAKMWFAAVVAVLLNLAIELMARHSFVALFKHITGSSLVFFYNILLIFMTLLFANLFRKRICVLCIVVAIWLTLGVTNGILLSFRATPFSAGDFFMFTAALSMITLYLKIWQIVLIGAAIAGAIFLLFLLWKKAPVQTVHFRKDFLGVVITIIVTACFTLLFIKVDVLSKSFDNLNTAYSNYGFNYCFFCSAFDRGIDEPDEYSERTLEEIRSDILREKTGQPETKPNIVFLQLESFFDVNAIKWLECSENPVPFFEELKKSYSSGFLRVPTIGAGTANTEFEVLTGMNRAYFGAGEYPYKTILQKATCETIATNLRELDYKSHAIHNNVATFYGRNTVFSQMGFDTFTSIEYMQDVKYNAIGWAEDDILVGEILKSLSSTKERDFVYTISVQGHGGYPKQPVDDKPITVAGVDETMKYSYQYYVNQLAEMDQFLSHLVEELKEFGEPVVLVLFGDHLPSLELKDEDLSAGDLYCTEYIMWSSYHIERHVQDIPTYQLSSYVLERLGINNGMLTKYHNICKDREKYLSELELIEYDILYGDHLLYDGVNPYKPTDLQMGIDEIKVTSVKQSWDQGEFVLYILGENFTKWSLARVNEDKMVTEYIDKNTLLIRGFRPEVGDIIDVIQKGKDSVVLSTTNEVIWGIR